MKHLIVLLIIISVIACNRKVIKERFENYNKLNKTMKNETSKLNKVTNKICELLKGTDLDPMKIKVGCVLSPEKIIWEHGEGDYGDGEGEYVFASQHQHAIYVCDIKQSNIIGSPIREAEVLTALKNVGDFAYVISDKGWLGVLGQDGAWWILGKPLSEQSEETIEFLDSVLN